MQLVTKSALYTHFMGKSDKTITLNANTKKMALYTNIMVKLDKKLLLQMQIVGKYHYI